MKTVIGVILLTLISAMSSLAQTLQKGEMVKLKADSTKIWIVDRAVPGGYMLRDSSNNQQFFASFEIRGLENEEVRAINKSTAFLGPSANIDKFKIEGMKPIRFETRHPSSMFIVPGLAFGFLTYDLISDANDYGNLSDSYKKISDNSTGTIKQTWKSASDDASSVQSRKLLAGIVSGIACVTCFIVSLETEDWAIYSNGMEVKVQFRP